jgi:hypothetical protein
MISPFYVWEKPRFNMKTVCHCLNEKYIVSSLFINDLDLKALYLKGMLGVATI